MITSLADCDYFTSPFLFKINGKRGGYKSSVGGLVSILLFVSLVGIFVYEMIQWLGGHILPQSSSYNLLGDFSISIGYSPIMFGMYDVWTDSTYDLDTVGTFRTWYFYWDDESQSKKSQLLTPVRCKKLFNNGKSEFKFQRYDKYYDNLFCIDPAEIKGGKGFNIANNGNSSIQLDVFACSNDNPKRVNQCMEKEAQEKLIYSGRTRLIVGSVTGSY